MKYPTENSDFLEEALRAPQTRRRFLNRAIAAGLATPVVASLLAACGGDVDDTGGDTSAAPTSTAGAAPGTTEETTDSSEETPVDSDATPGSGSTDAPTGNQGGTANVSVLASPTAWDLTKSDWNTWRSVHYLYDRLIITDAEEALVPHLAQSWEIADDGLAYTLALREDVLFHDGTPFNAEAVKFNIERHAALEDSAFYATFNPVESVEVIDDFTAEIILSEVRVNFIYDLSLWGSIQLSPTAYEELGDDFATRPVGTGPFKFNEYEPDSHIDFVRNEDYWAGAPLLDNVRVRIIPEMSVQLIEMETRTIDTMYAVDPKDVGALEDNGVIVEDQLSPGAVFISLNVSRGPTAELAVRKAIAHGIDRDTIISEVLLGFAEKARAGVPSSSAFYSEDIPTVEYDPEEAARLLDEAGWMMGSDGIRARDGVPLYISILSTDYSGYGLYNQIYQEQLKVLGIDSQITTLEWGAYLDQWRENQGDWHLTHHSQGSLLNSTAAIQASWAPSNFWNICQILRSEDPEIMALSEELEKLNEDILVTLDFDERVALGQQAQALYQEHQLTIWLWHNISITGVQPSLKDYDLTHAGRVVELTRAWVDA